MEKDMTDAAINALKTELSGVNEKLNSIYTLLKGHELSETGGLVQQIQTMEHRMLALEKVKDKITYVLMGCLIPASWGIIDVVKMIISAL